MAASAELGHRMEIILFAWRESIESHAEKLAIQSSAGLLACLSHNSKGDPRTLRHCPGVLAPLLQEVWIALRERHDLSEGIGIDLRAFLLDRFLNRLGGGIEWECRHSREIKQALDVRLGITSQINQLGQAGPEQDQRQTAIKALSSSSVK